MSDDLYQSRSKLPQYTFPTAGVALLQKDRSFEPDMAVMVEAPDHSRDVEGSIVLACRRWKIATACHWVAVIASACPIYLECLIKDRQGA